MEPDAEVQEDAYYDPQVGMVVTRSGKARWKNILAEREASRDHEAIAAFVKQLRQGPSAAA